MKPQFWMPLVYVAPDEIAERARRAEADGWDGVKLADTQCLHGDPFVMMTAGVLATETIAFSISASNPVTRHPAVAASAIASIATIAPGRVHYGIGRGDSALAYVGAAPASVAVFERYVAAMRSYLHGDPVAFESIRDWRLTADVRTIQLGHAPDASRLVWRDPIVTVPIEVFATGPRVISVAGRLADRASLALGADVSRLRWAIDIARDARRDAGLDPADLSLGAVVPIGVSNEMSRARLSVSNMVASAGRFAVISGRIVGPVTDAQRVVYEAIGRSYDMNRHGGHGSQVDALTDAFIDTYAIVGSPSACVERILELIDLGIDHIMLSPPLGDATEADRRDGYRGLVEDVLPGVRAALPKISGARSA
ncbi:MAG TPA: LLM class flavin-dependent oxidoreductase [Acidimicrobiales bacterium]|nr:LLM class flavin-dependent oxidoreductase [Acidimicrobiales bacterium]